MVQGQLLSKQVLKIEIIASYCGADGAYADTELLAVPAGGSTLPVTAENVKKQLHKVTMKGREVFKLGVRIMPEAALHTLQMAGLIDSEKGKQTKENTKK